MSGGGRRLSIPGDSQLRVLFFTLEYEDPIFSGNGVFSRTWVRALSSHPDISILVICARPQQAPPRPPPEAHSNVTSLSVPVPTWNKLDRHGPWKQYAHGAADLFGPQIASFAAHVALAVDWTGACAFRRVRKHAGAAADVPMTFLNFRVFSLSTGISGNDRRFYESQEVLAVEEAEIVVALCWYDAKVLKDLAGGESERVEEKLRVIAPILRREVRDGALKVVLKESSRLRKGLVGRKGEREGEKGRGSIRRRHSAVQMSISSTGQAGFAFEVEGSDIDTASLRRYNNVKYGFGGQPQKYHRDRDLAKWLTQHPTREEVRHARSMLTCCCRICPEKNVLAFVEVVEKLAAFLQENLIVVCLVGPVTDEAFGKGVLSRLRKAISVKALLKLIPRFVSHEELAGIFNVTLLNFHPATYEAFGMSVVEAAAYKAPTVMDSGGRVGVRDLLPAPQTSFLCDMTDSARTARDIKALLRPSSRYVLSAVAAAAQAKAFGWNEVEFCKKVQEVVWAGVNEDRLKAPPEYSVILDAAGPIAEEVWVLNSLAERISRVGKVDMNAEMVKEAIFALNKLSVYAFAVELGEHPQSTIGSRARSETNDIERALDQTETRWSLYFAKTSNTIMEARYLMVPARVKEAVFWHKVFKTIKSRAILKNID